MPNINYKNPPGSGTLATGASPTGVDISENWYFPTTAGDKSLEVINGHLDQANLDASFKFENKHFQKDSVSKSSMVGCTANIDYFGDFFKAVDTEDAAGTYDEKSDLELSKDAIVIPGLAIKFYVPYTGGAKCLFQWSFNQQNDGWFNQTFGAGAFDEMYNNKSFPSFFLFIDDVMDPVNARRYIPGGWRFDNFGGVTGKGIEYHYGRHWSGHKYKALAKGWHTADIRITLPNVPSGSVNVLSNHVKQCRVRSRGMRYILFR